MHHPTDAILGRAVGGAALVDVVPSYRADEKHVPGLLGDHFLREELGEVHGRHHVGLHHLQHVVVDGVVRSVRARGEPRVVHQNVASAGVLSELLARAPVAHVEDVGGDLLAAVR